MTRLLTKLDWIKRIKLGHRIPGVKVVERRSKGLHSIRREFLAQLLRASTDNISTSLVVRWHRQQALINARAVLDQSFQLEFYGAAQRVSGLFLDMWVLCYPEDPEVKQKVEEEIARMCQEAVKRIES